MVRRLGWMVLIAAALVPGSAPAQTTTRVNVAADGGEANGFSEGVRISGDGRYVAYLSTATNLVSGTDPNGDAHALRGTDLFRSTIGAPAGTIRITNTTTGSRQVSGISDDGRFMLYGGSPGAFVFDATDGTVVRADVRQDGTLPASIFEGPGESSVLAGGGRHVAFAASGTGFVASDPNGAAPSTFVRDLTAGTTTLISGSDSSRRPTAISDNGRFVLTTDQTQVQLHDLDAGTKEVVRTGTQAGYGTAVSDDGSRVLYVVDGALYQRVNGIERRVDVRPDGTSGYDGASALASDMSDNGRYVAFVSQAPGLVAGDGDFYTDAFVRDMDTGTTELVSVTSAGQKLAAGTLDVSLSENGRFAAFSSEGALTGTEGTSCWSEEQVEQDEGDEESGPPPPPQFTYVPIACRNVFLRDRGSADSVTETVAAGGTVSLPDAVAVTTPTGGTVSISATDAGTAPARYSLLGAAYSITAPAAPTSGDPLTLVFSVDSSDFAPGDAAALATVTLVRNSVAVPDCPATGIDRTDPDAVCVAQRRLVAGGGGEIVVSSWHASRWELARRVYSFTGFFQPVDAPPTYNAAKAGSSVPLHFSLGGDEGLGILSSVSTRAIDCRTGDPVDTLEQTAPATSRSGLQYDAVSERYTYVWRTSTTIKGCRLLEMTLADGSSHTARFAMK